MCLNANMYIKKYHFSFNKDHLAWRVCYYTWCTQKQAHKLSYCLLRLKLGVYLCYQEVRVNGGQLLAAACVSAMPSLCCIWVKALRRN